MSAETQLGDHLRRIRKLEAVASATPTGTQQLFPSRPSFLPVVSGKNGWRRWPGGVVVVTGYLKKTSAASSVTNTDQNSLSNSNTSNVFKVLSHDQVADDTGFPNYQPSGTPDISMTFTVGDVGLIPEVKYTAYASVRFPAGVDPQLFVSTTHPAGTSYPTNKYAIASGTGLSDEVWFGFRQFGMAGAGEQYLRWGALTDTVDVIVGYDSGGTADAVELDYIVFVPVYGINPVLTINTPTPVAPTDMWASYFQTWVSQSGPTTSYIGTEWGAPFNGDVYTDSQIVRGPLDPDFNFSFGPGGISSAYAYTRLTTLDTGNVTYPRHIYAAVRLNPIGSLGADGTGLWDEECYMTMLVDGNPIGASPIITASWHLVYLGCQYHNNPDNIAAALWTPTLNADSDRSWFAQGSQWHNPYMDASLVAVTSFLDDVAWPA